MFYPCGIAAATVVRSVEQRPFAQRQCATTDPGRRSRRRGTAGLWRRRPSPCGGV